MKPCHAILFALMIFAQRVHSAPLDETYEVASGMSGTLGSLHNQNGWKVLTGTATVQSNTVHASSQAVEIQTAAVQHELDSTESSAWITFWTYYTQVPTNTPTVDAAQSSLAFFVNTNQNLTVYSNTTPIELSVQIPTNAWVRFDIYCDYAATNWALNVNGVSAAAGLPLLASPAEMSALLIQNQGASSMYVDDILVADTEPTAYVPDSDADGIPDWWEYKHFGTVSAAGALNDADLDGSTDFEEYIAGLTPGVADAFQLNSLSELLEVTWNTIPGRLYSVYWTPSLDIAFTKIGNEIPWTQTSFIDITNTTDNTGFYRIGVDLP